LKLAIEKGDIDSYYSLSIAYLEHEPGFFLPIAFTMANKYDYPQAYFDVYCAIFDFNGVSTLEDTTDKIDRRSKEIALDYLIIGAKKGHHQSLDILLDDYLLKEDKYNKLLSFNNLKIKHKSYLDSLKNGMIIIKK
jgi:hypothetical protein